MIFITIVLIIIIIIIITITIIISQLERDLRRECPYLIPAVELVEYASFPKEFDDNKIFNDLSIITFPKDKVSSANDDFWNNVPIEQEEKV